MFSVIKDDGQYRDTVHILSRINIALRIAGQLAGSCAGASRVIVQDAGGKVVFDSKEGGG